MIPPFNVGLVFQSFKAILGTAVMFARGGGRGFYLDPIPPIIESFYVF